MSLSASVTRILTLSGFPPELKTRDIQAAFSDWENDRGGFKIKWVNDTTLMLVFNDAGTAKRAYLTTILNPPPQLISVTSLKGTLVKPYDGPDAQTIIANVNARTNNARGHGSRPSMANGGGSGFMPHVRQPSSSAEGHRRAQSYASGVGGSVGRAGGLNIAAANGAAGNVAREPSPTLPSLPSHPTLNSLISSSLSPELSPTSDSEGRPLPPTHPGTQPKVGDPARRMVGAALGIKHPGMTQKANDSGVKDITKAMGGIAVTAE